MVNLVQPIPKKKKTCWYNETGISFRIKSITVDRLVDINDMMTIIILFVWVLWHINLCGLFNAKSIFIQINSSISNTSV